MARSDIKGYVIVPPGDLAWQLCYWTFAPTKSEAWLRRIGHEVHDIDIPYRRQLWHDKGHRLREATLTIHPGRDEDEATDGKSPSSPSVQQTEAEINNAEWERICNAYADENQRLSDRIEKLQSQYDIALGAIRVGVERIEQLTSEPWLNKE